MAKRLEPYIGYRMSRAALSKAERSLHGGPIRRFDADEIFALARIFERHVGDFFAPPESYFDRRRLLINNKPGDPRADVTSKPVTANQAVDLSVTSGTPERASKYERKRQASVSKEIIELLARETRPDFRRAVEGALRGYLEAHPEALREVLASGFPNEAFETAEVNLTPPRKQRLFDKLAEVGEKPPGPKKKRKK
jgi:hypothetical protein